MQIASLSSIAAAGQPGLPAGRIVGSEKSVGEPLEMLVYGREQRGRLQGYGSLNTALSAARNLSRGADRSAVVVFRGENGAYVVREAVWQLKVPPHSPGSRVPVRTFHFEDGSYSQYTATVEGRKVQFVGGEFRSVRDSEATTWLVDGSRVYESR